MTDKKDIVKTKLVSFRIDLETDKKLSKVAEFKKESRTAIVKDLIRLAHIGIFSPEAQKLNNYFKEIEMKERKKKDELIRKKLDKKFK